MLPHEGEKFVLVLPLELLFPLPPLVFVLLALVVQLEEQHELGVVV